MAKESVKSVFCILVMMATFGGVVYGQPLDSAGTPVSQPASKPAATKIRLTCNGKPIEGRLLFKQGQKTWLKAVPTKGLDVPMPTKSVEVLFVCFPFAGVPKGKAYQGQATMAPGLTDFTMEVEEISAQKVTIRLQDKHKEPPDFLHSMDVAQYADGLFVGEGRVKINKNGEGVVFLPPKGKFRLRCHRNGITGYVQSPEFSPEDLRNNEFSYVVPSIEDTTVELLFIVKQGGREQKLVEPKFDSCEVLSVEGHRGGGFSTINGRLFVKVMPAKEAAQRNARFQRGIFFEGSQCYVRLPGPLYKKYDLAGNSQKFTVGKPGEKVKIYLVPRIRSQVSFEAFSPKGETLVGAVFVFSPVEKEQWSGISPKVSKELRLGEYENRVWCYGYRLYKGKFQAKAGKMVIKCPLAPAVKACLTVVDEAGKPLLGCARLDYACKDKEPPFFGRKLILNKKGNSEFYFDDDYPCTLLISRVLGYMPKVILLKKGQGQYRVQLSKDRPVQCVFLPGEFRKRLLQEAIKEGLPRKTLDNILWISQKPARVRVTRTELLKQKGTVALEPGVYMPIVELGALDPGKALVCKPVEITAEVKSVKIIPVEIKKLSELIDRGW
jgi:hypothetical protein